MVKSPSQKKLIGILNNCVLVLLVVINLLKETKLTIAHRRSSKVRLTQLKNKKCPETLLKLLALVLELWINNITMSLPNIVLVRTQISGREAPFKVMLLKELLIERETILEILVGVQSTLWLPSAEVLETGWIIWMNRSAEAKAWGKTFKVQWLKQNVIL